MVPRTCLFIFDASSRRLGSSNSWNSSYKEKTVGLARVSRLSFRFLWLWLSIPNILHSVGERVDCVLLIVLVLLLSKHNYAPPNLNKKHCECLCCGVYMNLLMLLWKTGCMGCVLCQNILAGNKKKWLFGLFSLNTVKSKFSFSTNELVVDVVVCMDFSAAKIQKVVGCVVFSLYVSIIICYESKIMVLCVVWKLFLSFE